MNSTDVIILIVLLLVLTTAIKQSLLHLKGEGSCCGGPKEKVVKKKIKGKPLETVTLQVEGMHCTNCKNRIEAHLNKLDGVIAKVNLEKKLVIVKLYQVVEVQKIIETIEQLDFKVVQTL